MRKKKSSNNSNTHKPRIIAASLVVIMVVMALAGSLLSIAGTGPVDAGAEELIYDDLSGMEASDFNGSPYKDMGLPSFSEKEITSQGFADYADLDNLGRCQAAIACIGPETMPTEERGAIGMVKPSGWHTVRYDDLIKDKFLYNRCHLIGFQLAGANADERNLVTGTRYMNVDGMLPFENEIADYVEDTGCHVMYRVTPVFEGNDLVCQGVLMEALSVEDGGSGVCFSVFCYNVQPGIQIDYATGESWREAEGRPEIVESGEGDYIVNMRSDVFHKPDCQSVKKMAEQNRKKYHGDRKNLIDNGYSPCGVCNP